MVKDGMRFMILTAAVVLSASSSVSAKTWHLARGRNWKALSEQDQDKYVLAVAQIKKLVNKGQTRAVPEALDRLKKDFPEIVGPDLEAFFKAEMLFCNGKFTKAVRSYEKFLDEFGESELYEAALDRQFAIATAFLDGQKKKVLGVLKMRRYHEGVKIMERISDRAGDAPIAVKADMAVVKSYERRRKFTEVYHKWSQIRSQWPTGQTGKDALLGMARCKHDAYRGPKYNASNLISAKSYYEDFRLRYPQEAKEIEIDKKLLLIEEQLALKQFSIGRYYQKTGSRQSADLYYQMVVDNWPKSKAAKMAKKMMNRNMDVEEIKK